MALYLYLDELEGNLSALDIEFLCSAVNSYKFTLIYLVQACSYI